MDFWYVSPAYVLLRMGGLVLILIGIEWLTVRGTATGRTLALLGHETLLVYVLHLVLLFGGVLLHSPLSTYAGSMGFPTAAAVLLAMLPVLYAAAWLWNRLKVRYTHAARLVVVFVTVYVAWEFLTRPW